MAQLSFSFQSIDVGNGLSSNLVTSIAQDEKGYIWMGTSNGIQCYDMYGFVDERSIDGPDRIYIDTRGRKWMAGSSGIELYDYRLRKTKHVPLKNDSKIYAPTFPHWIYEDTSKRLWVRILFDNGETKYYCFNEAQGKFFPYDSILPSTKRIMTVINDSGDQDFWIGTRDGLIFYDHESKSYLYPGDLKFPLPKFAGAFDPTHSLYTDRRGNLIIVTWSSKPWSSPHLYIVDKKGRVLLDHVPYGDVRGVIADSANNIWVAGERLVRIDDRTKAVEVVTLPQNAGVINAISLDREGNIWLGTQRGILVFDPGQRFDDKENVGINGDKYRGETLALLATYDGVIVVGTWGGNHIYLYDKNFKPLSGIDGFPRKEFSDRVVFPVWTLLESSDRSIWIGGQHGKLIRLNRKEKRTEQIDEMVFKQQTIRAIHEDVQHNIWFSTQTGLILKRDNRSGMISEIGRYGLGFAYFMDDGPFLWASTGTNLVKISLDSGKIEGQYSMKLNKPKNNVIVRLSKIIEVNGSKIILTSSEGLIEFDKISKEFRVLRFDSHYFKPETAVKNYLSIEAISKGKYIASLDGGVILNSENQLLSALQTKNFFISNSSLKLPDGRLVFGSETGFTVVKPSFVRKSLVHFKAPSINSVFLQNKAANVDSIMRFGLTLNHDQNYFSMTFSALLFRERENVHYFYRVDESREFINIGHSRRISYGGLPAGKHRLEIYFSTSETKSPSTSVLIEIIPPFWARWWFIAISIIVTISIFTVIYRIRISKIKELAHVREKIARDIHDEMGSNISTISILSNVLKDKLTQTGTSDKETQILEKISRLSTEALEAASEIVWSVNPKNDSMKEVARRMRVIGSQLEDFGINFSFIVEGDITGREFMSEARNNFYLIYKEIITNIGKHSKCRNVSVMIDFTREFGEMIISDDGVGFDVKNDRVGNGLKNMMSRAQKMNGNLTINSEAGKGTITKFRFPI